MDTMEIQFIIFIFTLSLQYKHNYAKTMEMKLPRSDTCFYVKPVKSVLVTSLINCL